MNKTLLLISLPLWLGCALPAQAGGGVWRCAGNSYSDTPCSQGRQIALADDAPRAADVAAAQAVAASEQRLAAALRAERLQREASAQPLPASRAQAHARPAAKPAAKTAAQRVKPKAAARPAADDTWRAIAPASRRAAG